MRSLTALVPLLLWSVAVASVQEKEPWTSEKFTILKHENHPDHKLRILAHGGDESLAKETGGSGSVFNQYCLGATKGYTGYLSTAKDTKHFWFAFFESRSDPTKDPVFLWLNGGPGCSSSTGLFIENGPCLVNEAGTGTRRNPYSWINNASGFWLDQPLNVGWSYSSETKHLTNSTYAASDDVYAFLSIWYKNFPQYRKLPFHMTGESYAGRYVPTFASNILKKNEEAAKLDKWDDLIPLESIVVGNGLFDEGSQDTSYYDIACTNASGVGAVLDKQNCDEMSTHVSTCAKMWTECDNTDGKKRSCLGAYSYCFTHLETPYLNKTNEAGQKRNPYDITRWCMGELCFPIETAMVKYLNLEPVRDAFHVDKAAKKFESCNTRVNTAFWREGDMLGSSTAEMTFLLNQGTRVLVYAGNYDWYVTHTCSIKEKN